MKLVVADLGWELINYCSLTDKSLCLFSSVAQSCPIPCDPTDCSLYIMIKTGKPFLCKISNLLKIKSLAHRKICLKFLTNKNSYFFHMWHYFGKGIHFCFLLKSLLSNRKVVEWVIIPKSILTMTRRDGIFNRLLWRMCNVW